MGDRNIESGDFIWRPIWFNEDLDGIDHVDSGIPVDEVLKGERSLDDFSPLGVYFERADDSNDLMFRATQIPTMRNDRQVWMAQSSFDQGLVCFVKDSSHLEEVGDWTFAHVVDVYDNACQVELYNGSKTMAMTSFLGGLFKRQRMSLRQLLVLDPIQEGVYGTLRHEGDRYRWWVARLTDSRGRITVERQILGDDWHRIDQYDGYFNPREVPDREMKGWA